MIETGVVILMLWGLLFAPLGAWTTYDRAPTGVRGPRPRELPALA